MPTKDQSYMETYAEAKKIAPQIDGLLRRENPAVRTKIEQESRALLYKYEPRRVFINNVVENIGTGTFLAAFLSWGVPGLMKSLDQTSLREHAHLLALGGIGVLAATAIALADNRYHLKLYRAFAYLQRQNGSEQQVARINVPYAKVNLENLICTTS